MLNRRTLLGAAGASPLIWTAAFPAFAQTPRDLLVMAIPIDDMVSLDPQETFEFSAGEVAGNTYDRLILPNLKDPTDIKPDLAASWTTSEDGLTTTFKMAPGRKFASGNPVTAEDAAFTLQRAVMLNKAPAFIINQFGFTPANVAERIRATDEMTLVLTLAEKGSPSFLLYCLSATVGSIVDKKTVMARAVGEDMGNTWLKAGNSAGSGPFQIRQWRASENVTLDANPNHPNPPKIRRIVIQHRPDPSAQLLGLQRGDIDIARRLAPDQLAALAKDPAYTLLTQQKSYINYLALNQSHPMLSRPQVRQAIKWAIDYKGIAAAITPSTYEPHQAFLPKGFPGALTDLPFSKDVAKAKALLAEAGVPNGFEVTFDHPSTAPFADWAQAIQANLAEIGIKATLIAGESRQVITKTRARQHQMAMVRWGSDYMDPHSNAETFNINTDNSEAQKNRTLCWRSNWKDDDFTARAIEAQKEPDAGRRVALYERLQRDHQERSPFVMLGQEVEVAAMKAGTTGLELALLSDRSRYAAVTKG
ncbi:MAG: ABC transporter substrate-binding protein [Gemmatimonadaceae bacterium]|nr:ABC transporter substrate-binding protein [Acetobacteraceae bacterium]